MARPPRLVSVHAEHCHAEPASGHAGACAHARSREQLSLCGGLPLPRPQTGMLQRSMHKEVTYETLAGTP